MGYDFVNSQDEEFGLSSIMWDELRCLAEEFGWEPEGTFELTDEEAFWETKVIEIGGRFGSYTGNAAQVVTASDASKLANALTLALASENYGKIVSKLRKRKISFFKRLSTPKVRLKLEEVDLLQHRECALELVRYCNRGAFIIV